MSDVELEQRLRAHYRSVDPGHAPVGLGSRISDALDARRGRPTVTLRLGQALGVLAAALVVAVGLAFGLGGQAPSVLPSESVGPTVSPLSLLELPLPTRQPADRSNGVCAGVGLSAVLAGDPSDPRVVWLANQLPGGRRLDVVWPDHYRARFSPALEILDQLDRVVLRGGDLVHGGCVESGGLLLLEPPFE
jgi:hypothetical protein